MGNRHNSPNHPINDSSYSSISSERKLEMVLQVLELAKKYKMLSQFLQAYLEYSLGQIGAECGSIHLLEDEKLVIRAVKGNVLHKEHLHIKEITEQAIHKGQTQYTQDVFKDPDYLGLFEETRCTLRVPLKVAGTILGMIVAEHSQIDAFNVNQRYLFEFLASKTTPIIQDRLELEQAHQKVIATESEVNFARMSQMMAHHLKNYLGSARIQLYNVMQYAELASDQRKELENADANMKRCVEIIEALFRPYRPAVRTKVSIDLLVKKALDHLGVSHDVHIKTSIPEDLSEVLVEIGGSVDFFYELLLNAVKAVRKSLQDGAIKCGYIKILGAFSSERKLTVSFINNGPPIPKEMWESIFEPFSNISGEERSSGHFGLGLWGARIFFRRQGGNLYLLESNTEHTIFVVELPSV